MSKTIQVDYIQPVIVSNYNRTEEILSQRTTEKKIIKKFKSIRLENNQFYIIFEVVEESEISGYARKYEKEYLVPDYTLKHLFHYLGIPLSTGDYIRALVNMEGSEARAALINESNHLAALMEKRIKKVDEGKQTLDIILHVVSDIFGTFPRAITSTKYVHYRDIDSLYDTQKIVDEYNTMKDKEYEFSNAVISPYSTKVNYISDYELIHGDEIGVGCYWFNSETKYRSWLFGQMVLRMICTNGLYGIEEGDDVKIPHIGEGFNARRVDGAIKIMESGNKVIANMKKLEEFSEPISDEWEDFMNVPSKLLQLKKADRKEVIEIAKKENYPFTPYGIVQALTYKATHNPKNLEESKSLNKKANSIIINGEEFYLWDPNLEDD